MLRSRREGGRGRGRLSSSPNEVIPQGGRKLDDDVRSFREVVGNDTSGIGSLGLWDEDEKRLENDDRRGTRERSEEVKGTNDELVTKAPNVSRGGIKVDQKEFSLLRCFGGDGNGEGSFDVRARDGNRGRRRNGSLTLSWRRSC